MKSEKQGQINRDSVSPEIHIIEAGDGEQVQV